MSKLMLFSAFSLIFLLGLSFAWTDLGGGVCACGTTCNDCYNALNNNVNCTAEVRLTTALSAPATHCIYDPPNFNNKIFDCQGNTITGAGIDYGILTLSKSGNTIKNCRIFNFEEGIFLFYGHNSNITNNTVYGNSWAGIYMRYSDNNTFINNTAYNNSQHGFHLFEYCFNNTFINNTARDNPVHGFTIARGIYNTFINNSAYDNGNTGFQIITYTNHSRFINNTVYNNSYAGFYVSLYVFNNTFINNSIYTNRYGLYLTLYNTYNNFINNTVHHNSDDAFRLYNYNDYNTFINNTVHHNTGASFSLQVQNNHNNFINNTAHNNIYGAHIQDHNDYNDFINNTFNNNIAGGFYIVYSNDYNTFTSNTVNGNGDAGFRLIDYNEYNNFTNNTARGGFIGFFVDANPSDYNTFINNTAYDAVNGFWIFSSNSIFINNTASNNSQWGFNLYYSTNNTLINNTFKENGIYDFHLEWGLSDLHCNNRVENMTGSGGRPIYYANSTVVWSNLVASEVFLCNADNSVLTNITVNGSDTLWNNGFVLMRTENALVNSSLSADNYYGFHEDIASSNIYSNNTAYGNQQSGFHIQGTGTVLTGNTAHNNNEAGFHLTWQATNTILTNNTAHSNAEEGVILDGGTGISINHMILYSNDPDFQAKNDADYAAVGLLFLDPPGTFENYTNLSLTDSAAERYWVNWIPFIALPSLPPATLLLNRTLLLRPNSPSTIDVATWSWTDAELAASGLSESTLDIWQFNGTNWTRMGATLNTGANTLTINNFVFPQSAYVIADGRPPPPGGGEDDGKKKERECTRDSQCPDCYRCTIESRCAPKSESECYSAFGNYAAKGCQEAYTCVACTCTPGCIVDADCDPGYRCEDYSCVPPICMVDSECPDGYECRNYNCVPEPRPEPEPQEPGEPTGEGTGEVELPAEVEPRPEAPLPEHEGAIEQVIPLVEGSEITRSEMGILDTISTEMYGIGLLFLIVILILLYLKYFRKKEEES